VLYAFLTFAVVCWHHFRAPLPELGSLAHSLLGVALGMLLVFRTNSSYDRFWEGRKRWDGVINSARDLVRGGVAYSGDAADLARIVAAYPVALKQHLRGGDLDELDGHLDPALLDAVRGARNPPSRLTLEMSRWIATRGQERRLPSVLVRTLEERVTDLIEHQGACERIHQTPVPFAYVAQIRQLLMVYLSTLPFVLVPRLEWLAIPAVALVAFGLIGIEEAGVEIEDPFGTDPNDLPLDDMCRWVREEAAELVAADRHAPEAAGGA